VNRLWVIIAPSAFNNSDVPPSTDPFYAGLGQAVRIGTELLASVIVGGGFGWSVDTYLLGSSPWGIVIGLILGVAAGVRNAYRRAQHWTTGQPGTPTDER
jgi:ATP synthase protein I